MLATAARSMALNAILAAAACALLAGCDRGGTTSPPQPGAKPGKLVGKLADARGNPLGNVTISVFGFSEKGEPVSREVTIEGPADHYEIDLPPGKYNTPTARLSIEYDERWYTLPLASADNTKEWTEQKESAQGMVRDFVWRIAGPVPGGDPTRPTGYWGGTIQFDKGNELGDAASIEITLAPEGPLIDGSEGKPVTFVRTLPWKSREDHLLFDVPLGHYVATARLLFGSRPRPLRLFAYTVDPTNPEAPTPPRLPTKVPIDFECIKMRPGEWRVLTPNLLAFAPQ
jgi:hypothetical protein